MIFDQFSVLLEDLAVATGKLNTTGHFNFHFDDANDWEAEGFIDLLQSAGFKQKIIGATHRHEHTLDLVIIQNYRKSSIIVVQSLTTVLSFVLLICPENAQQRGPCIIETSAA